MTANELLFINKVKVERQAFGDKVIKIASDLSVKAKVSIDPDWLMFLMNHESAGTFSPSIKNKQGAIGLIQIMPKTAIALNTTVEALAKLSAVEQLDWVYKYYYSFMYLSPKSLHDMGLVTFYPLAVKKPMSYIIGSEKGPDYAALVAKQNPSLDFDKKPPISKLDYYNAINKKIDEFVTSPEKREKLKKKH